MPGLWVHLPDNPEYFRDFDVVENAYYELKLYDDDAGAQGTGLWQVTPMIERKKEGMWVQGRLIADRGRWTFA